MCYLPKEIKDKKTFFCRIRSPKTRPKNQLKKRKQKSHFVCFLNFQTEEISVRYTNVMPLQKTNRASSTWNLFLFHNVESPVKDWKCSTLTICANTKRNCTKWIFSLVDWTTWKHLDVAKLPQNWNSEHQFDCTFALHPPTHACLGPVRFGLHSREPLPKADNATLHEQLTDRMWPNLKQVPEVREKWKRFKKMQAKPKTALKFPPYIAPGKDSFLAWECWKITKKVNDAQRTFWLTVGVMTKRENTWWLNVHSRLVETNLSMKEKCLSVFAVSVKNCL